MANQFRTVRCDMWRKDEWFCELAPDAKLVWIYAFTNEATSPAGIYRITLRTIANETGVALERVREIIAEFDAAGKLHYEDGIIWPVTMRKHQLGELKATDNLVAKVRSDLAELKQSPIVARYMEYYGPLPERDKPLPTPSEAPSEGFRLTDTDTGNKNGNGKNGASAGAIAPVVSPDDPLTLCLKYLDEPKADKPAAVGRLMVLRFGDKFKPSYGRIGTMAKQISGDYKTLAQMVWDCSKPEGDPHDYLQGIITKSKARRAQAEEASAVY